MEAFTFFKSFKKALDRMGSEDRLLAYDTLVTFALTGERAETGSIIVEVFMDSVEPIIAKAQKQVADGKKGGRPRKETSLFEEENHPFDDEERDAIKNKEQEQEKEHKNKEQETKKPAARESDFNELWGMYPRKEGKREAFEAFKRAVHDGCTVSEIKDGINRYKSYILSKRIEPRYIKQGSTYFRQRAWLDELGSAEQYDVGGYSQRYDDMSDALMDL